MRRRICKTDPVLEITFAMAKAETPNVGKHVLLPFLPLKGFEMLRALELDLSESFHLPEKPRMLDYNILLFREDFRTKFILVPTSTWAIKAKKEKEIKHFYEDCFEEMIVVNKEYDDAAEELTDGPEHLLAEEFKNFPRKNGPIRSFFRGSSVFDDNATSNIKEPSSNDNPASINDKPSSNGNAASSNDNYVPETVDVARTQQRLSSQPDPALESVGSAEAKQSTYFTYPAVGGVPSGKLGAPEFKMLQSDDDEVNDMIVDAEFGDLKETAEKKDICLLGTSVWPALLGSDAQNLDLETISSLDKFFDYGSAVIPIPTTIAGRVIWAAAIINGHKRLLENDAAEVPRVLNIFYPITPESDDLPEVSIIQEHLQAFLAVVAHEQHGLEHIAKGGAVTLNVSLNVSAETQVGSSGLQVIEFAENFLKDPQVFLNSENARPRLRPGAKRTHIEAKYKTACENLHKLLRPEVIMPRELVHWRLERLATKCIYFVNPQCYTDLYNNGNEMNFESARRWIPNDNSLHDKFIVFPVLEVNEGEPQWLLVVIREPSRLRTGRKIKDLIIGIDSGDLRWHHVYHQLFAFWLHLMDIPFPSWARNGKTKVKSVEGYSRERDVPKQKKSLHSPYLLLRNAAELAEDPEGFLGGSGDNQSIVDDIVPEAIMGDWWREIEQIMGTSKDSINRAESGLRKRKHAGSVSIVQKVKKRNALGIV